MMKAPREGEGMPTFKDYDQRQAVFPDIRPLDLLEEDHPARVIDRVVELLDLEELYGQYGEEGKPGQGYCYEHLYAEHWNAMRGYHYLMRIGRLLNLLAEFSATLVQWFRDKGPQGFITFVRTTLSGPWLDNRQVDQRLSLPFQLRLVALRRPAAIPI